MNIHQQIALVNQKKIVYYHPDDVEVTVMNRQLECLGTSGVLVKTSNVNLLADVVKADIVLVQEHMMPYDSAVTAQLIGAVYSSKSVILVSETGASIAGFASMIPATEIEDRAEVLIAYLAKFLVFRGNLVESIAV